MLSPEEIAHLARLARIELAPAESATLLRELNGILAMVQEMAGLDTTGVEPMSHPQTGGLRLREDVVSEADARERFQALAPRLEDGLYLVPRVIE
jgi:aspartyl-tRNA(Asn)/glutamyl-tRNA(Gln) amidotransferase subunit C